MGDVTRILSQIESGDPNAAEQLLPLVYDELRKLATLKMAQENPGQTLQATAIVHAAYLRLVDVEKAQHWDSRGHFFAAAADAMRRILVENARRKKTIKRGGGAQRVDLHEDNIADTDEFADVLALDDALDQLELDQPAAAKVVKLRYFAGLSIQDTASSMKISIRTVNRHWAYAKAFLFDEMHK